MKIVAINIYGYGKFENVTFPDLHSLQVFFGENEAGKSTIMSFIHSILFGFPTRLQSELRYEPKKGAKYGGSLTVIFPEKGKVVIERVKGKAAGDVSVTMDNGVTGGEELLKELLSSLDKSLYQAIYSFNLHGLQNVHQMKGEELGRFLFSTGVIGSDRLAQAENHLTKELDSRFKPNGRNPLLNMKLKELRHVWQELKKAEENNGQYIRFIAKREAVEAEIEEQKKRVAELSQQLTRFEQWKKAGPLLRQEKVFKEELARLGDFDFPENGLQQLDHLLELESSIERNQAVLTKKLESLEAELAEIKPDFTLIHMEQEVTKAAENLKLLETQQQEELQLQVKLKKVTDDIVLLQNKLHSDFSDEEILGADTSIFMRGQAAQLMANQKRLNDKKQELDEQFQQEKNRLEELEKRIQAVKDELLPEEERKRMKGQLIEAGTKEMMLERHEEVKQRLLFLTNTLKHAQQYKNREKKQLSIYLVLCLLLLAAGWMAELAALSVIGGAGFLAVLYFLLKKRPANDVDDLQEEIRKWQEKENAYKEKLNRPDGELNLLEQSLKRDDMLREKLLSLQIKLEEQQLQYDRVIDKYEQWERETASLQQQLLSAGKALKLPEQIALNYLFDAFQMVDELKRKTQEKQHLLEQLAALEQISRRLREPLQKLKEQFFPSGEVSLQEAVLSLKRRLRQELDKGIKYEEKEGQFTHLKEEHKEYVLELERLRREKGALFASAACENEEQFRHTARKAAQRKEWEQELEQLSLQLKMLSLAEYEREELYDDSKLEEWIQEAKEQIEDRTLAQNKLHEELAEIKHHIQLLEDGGTYAELLHRYKLLQSDFASSAREWAVYMTAKDMLQKTVQTFKEERLPLMLQKAQEYLSFLTEGEYIRMRHKEEGNGFLIERKDGLIFTANELSQATAEQVYVSIRLALAVTIYEKYKFPIMIDDSFVNFDAKRTEKVLELLKQLKEHQILFFTCHKHLLPYFKQEDIIHLQKVHSMTSQ